MAHLSDNITGSVMDPVRNTQRIPSIDILRGVALLGLILINIMGMAFPGLLRHPCSGPTISKE
jgi:uncharacterized membrane protein YeiB